MEVREIENSGAFLTLEVDGVIREFFIVSKTIKFSDFSSSLINAGDCVQYSATLSEIVSEKYDTYGLQIRTGYKEFEYFRGYRGLDYVVHFRELGNPAKNKNKSEDSK